MYAREKKCVALTPAIEITVAIVATRNVLQWGCQEKVRGRFQIGRNISDLSLLFLLTIPVSQQVGFLVHISLVSGQGSDKHAHFHSLATASKASIHKV